MNLVRLDYEVIQHRMSEILRIEHEVHQTFGVQYDQSLWGKKEFAYPLTKKDQLSIGIEHGDQLCGFSIAYEYESGTCHISRVAVDPGFSGKGYGKELLKEQLNRMKQLRMDFCTIDLTLINDRAFQFYGKLGFQRIEGEELINYVLKKNRIEHEYLGDSPSHCAMKVSF